VEVDTEVAATGQPKKMMFRKYSYRGVHLDALLDMSTDDLVQLFPTRAPEVTAFSQWCLLRFLGLCLI
jgi:small subunit ribosomal protein S15e